MHVNNDEISTLTRSLCILYTRCGAGDDLFWHALY